MATVIIRAGRHKILVLSVGITFFVFSAVLATLLLAGVSANAASCNWIGPTSGTLQWTSTTGWSCNPAYPGQSAGDTAVIATSSGGPLLLQVNSAVPNPVTATIGCTGGAAGCTVEILSGGSLALTGASQAGTAGFSIPNAFTVDLSGTLSNTGTLAFSNGGILNLDGGTLDNSTVAGVTFATATSGTPGTFNWSGGTVQNTGSLVVQPAGGGTSGVINMTGTQGPMTLDGQTITDNGRIIFSSASKALTISNGGNIAIPTGGQMTLSSTGPINAGAGSSLISITGLLSQSPGAAAVISVPVNNNAGGTVQADSGILKLAGGGTHAGSFTLISIGAGIAFAGTHSFGAGTTFGAGFGTPYEFSGAGTLINVNTPLTIPGLKWLGGTIQGGKTLSLSGTSSFDSSTAALAIGTGTTVQIPATATTGSATLAVSANGGLSGPGTLAINTSGTASVNGPANVIGAVTDINGGTVDFASLTSILTLNGGGSLTGATLPSTAGVAANSLTFGGGTFALHSGTLQGAGPITVNSGATLSIDSSAGTVAFSGSPAFSNSGTVNVAAPTTSVDLGGFAITNQASGVIDLQTDASLATSGGATIANAGLFKKTAAAGTSAIAAGFTNSGGTAGALSGTMNFTNGYVQSAGTTTLNGGTISVFTGTGILTLNGGTLNGAGTIQAALGNNSPAAVSPGFPGVPGTISVTGNYTQSGALNVKLAGTTAGQFDMLAVGGSASLGGSLGVTTVGPFTPPNGSVFNILTTASRTGTFAPTTFPSAAFQATYTSIAAAVAVTSIDMSVVYNPAAPSSVCAGSNATYTMVVTNGGSSSATNVTLTNTFSGASFVSATTTAGTCSGSNPVTCTIGSLASGATATVTVTVNGAGPINNSAQVSATEFDPLSANNLISAATTVTPLPAATITAGGSTTFCAGGSVTLTASAASSYLWSNGAVTQSITVNTAGSYSVTVTNAAGCSATSAPTTVAVTPLPNASITAPTRITAGTSAAASVPAGLSGTTYSWIISGGSITSGLGTPNINFTGISDPVALSVTVTVGSCSNNGSATVSVGPSADLAVSKRGPVSASSGATVVYVIGVGNNGPNDATSIVVDDPTPVGLTLVSVSGPCSSFPCTIDTLSVLQTVTFTATYTVSGAPSTTVTNVATVRSSTTDVNSSNNTVSLTTSVAPCSATAPTLLAPIAGAQVASPVTFAWTAVTGATQYDVYQSTAAGNVNVGTTTAPSAGVAPPNSLVANVASGPLVWYVVATVPGCGPLQSATASANACNAPAAPTVSVVANAASGQTYTILWDTVLGATSYEVQEATSATFAGATTQTVTTNSVNFTHTATGNATPYFYRVRGVAACGGNPQVGPYSLAIHAVILPEQSGQNLNSNVPAGSKTIVIQKVFIPGQPDGTYSYAATVDKPWMSINLPTGILTPSGITLGILADPSNLPNGTFTGTVIVTLSPLATSNARVQGTVTVSVPVSVSLVTPVTPTTKTSTAANALIIPSVGHLDGINSAWQSDIRLANVGFSKQQYVLTFTPSATGGTSGGVKATTLTVDAGATTALDDIVRNWYGVGSLGEAANGVLEIKPLSAGQDGPGVSLTTVASSRTYSVSTQGTLGQYIPAIPFSSFIGKAASGALGTVLSLQQVAQSSAYRTNIGVVEGAGAAAAVTLSVYDDTGKKLTDYALNLNPYQQVQLNSFLSSQNITLNDGRIEAKVTGGDGKITAYASVVDNATNDPLLVSGVAVGQTLASRFVLAGVAALNNGIANWQTDMRIYNGGAAPQAATLSLYPLNGGAPLTATTNINPSEVKTLDSVVQTLFGQSNLGGALHVTTTSDANLIVSGRTYNRTATGTYGQFIPAVTANDAVGLNGRALNILQVEDSPRYRTNLGIAEVTGKPATVQIMVFLPDSKVTPKIEIPLAAYEYRQFPIIQSLGLGNIYNARINIQVISGDGKITAYGSVIDQTTQDPTYVPAQ